MWKKEIKSVMENPALDRNNILQMQRKMLMAKMERLGRLVASIDDILKGDNRMDFAIFNRTEMEEMFQAMVEHMPEEIKKTAINEFGGLEQWKDHYMKTVSSEDMQKRYQKMVEWFGGKEEYLATVKKPLSKEVAASYQKRLDVILEKLAGKQKCPADSFEVKEIIGEYGFVMKQLCQMKDEKEMMLSLAQTYHNEKIKSNIDKKYDDGTAQFFMQAIETFYK